MEQSNTTQHNTTQRNTQHQLTCSSPSSFCCLVLAQQRDCGLAYCSAWCTPCSPPPTLRSDGVCCPAEPCDRLATATVILTWTMRTWIECVTSTATWSTRIWWEGVRLKTVWREKFWGQMREGVGIKSVGSRKVWVEILKREGFKRDSWEQVKE